MTELNTIQNTPRTTKKIPVKEIENVTIRFAGDSGDGMQLTGTQFTDTAATIGNDISTFPDFPAEIRAPAGSLPGVSGFQLNFSSKDIRTAGDAPNVLVAMNPAALKVHLKDLERGGILIVNQNAFNANNLKKAFYETNPLEDGSLGNYQVYSLPISKMNEEALKGLPVNKKEIDRSKNLFALGIMYWLYDRPLEGTMKWIDQKFAKVPNIAEANKKSLQAGFNFGDTCEMFPNTYQVHQADLPKGKYRQITGNRSIALGIAAAAQLSGKQVFYGSYPITPASDILHEISAYKNYNITTFQAEDEIAAVCSAIGASFAGSIGVTGTSGPGIALKGEALGLAVMTELPLVVINVQRAGPSTGMPTKTEQSDLFQALYGRHGECPMVVIAPITPVDCFFATIEAFKIATKYMVPVMLLSDNTLANGAEPWKIPTLDSLPKFDKGTLVDVNNFKPYARNDKTLARPWVIPGTPGLEHRIGGLEKADLTGNISYDPMNHEKMVQLRAAKVEKVAQEYAPTEVYGPSKGKLLVIGWGSTFGAIMSACDELRKEGIEVSNLQLRHIHPLPSDLRNIISQFDEVLVPELNMGQLLFVLRAKYLTKATGLNKVQGQPFKIREIKDKIKEMLGVK
ncbi:MAG: 2-oxoacid:acceptor oxidoreductase subunit alpha [Proteobacteria bacterium]|jgi:2-oxoglutarate ferredoxin oxidoreductase subunit alpha|nr:2-oxoacid:acceptor oxidoreductase subunit alpha [Pseudomonadota bacterium]